MNGVKVGLGLALGVVALVGLGWMSDLGGGQPSPPAPTAAAVEPPARPTGCEPDPTSISNIHADDYVGPEACSECHAERHEQWRAHPHSRMNQNATEDAVQGDFSGVEAEYGGVRTVFERKDGAYTMSFYRGDELLRRDRITRTIGSRLQQAYVGVQAEGPEPPDHPIYTTERALSYVYWFSRKQWLPEHYVEQYPGTEYDAEGQLRYPTDDPHSRGTRPWSEGCLLCHNTYPYEFRFNREVPGRGFEGASLKDCYTEAPATGPMPADLVTLGVSCEACHFGGREHVEQERDSLYFPSSANLVAWEPAGGGPKTAENPKIVNSICSQCHVASNLAHANSASAANSSEALDMLGGACNSAIRCTDCHDPHVASPPGGGPDNPAHVAACTGCHESLADESARKSHARHSQEAASCLDCHMQRITQGIDTVVRSHRIDSPTNVAMLEQGGPNACNLCHLDRPITWTLAELRKGWGQAIEPEPGWNQYYGDGLKRAVGEAWLEHPTPVNRLIAADAYSRTQLGKRAFAKLLDILMDPYPENRMFGLMAIERILGRRITEKLYTPTASREVRAKQVRALRSARR